MERVHEFATKAVLAIIFEDGKTAQSVMRDAARRKSRRANGPNRQKRRHEAEQEVLRHIIQTGKKQNVSTVSHFDWVSGYLRDIQFPGEKGEKKATNLSISTSNEKPCSLTKTSIRIS